MKLQTKILTTVIAISFSVNIAFQFNDMRQRRAASYIELSNKIEKDSQLMSNVNAGPLFYYDTYLIETNIESFLIDPEIISIDIIETSGEINLNYRKDYISISEPTIITTPVSYENEEIGTITVSYTRDMIDQQLASAMRNSVISMILASIVTAIVLIFIIRTILQPIVELTVLTGEISSGNLDKEIINTQSDEIGQLTRSFMIMRDSIKEKIESLHNENEERKKAEIALTIKSEELAAANNELMIHRTHLEELVSQRTSQLQDSLDRLEATKDQLVESEKMASLGDLVAGVAHEINTPIGVGVTAASHLEAETKEFLKAYEEDRVSRSLFLEYVDLARESSSIILSNMLRAANLIKSFKKVAVDQSSDEKRKFKIEEYINEILTSIHSKFKHTKHRVVVTCKEDFEMNSNPGALSQIITNLCFNSLQHGFEGIENGIISINVEKRDSRAIITYKDNGIGIAEDIEHKIYDPFVTTKRGQGGSGLGMNIVYNLVKQTLKGSINHSSKKGEGITFNIILPLEI